MSDIPPDGLKNPPILGNQKLSRERLIEMLTNYANGTYQAIAPDVVGEAVRHLAKSRPSAERTLSAPSTGTPPAEAGSDK